MPPRTATTTTTRGQRALTGTTTSNKNKRRALSDASNVNSLDATVSASQSKKTKKKPKKKASGSHLQPTHHRDGASENEEKDDDAKKKRLLFEELMHELDLECAFSSFTSSLGRVMVALSACARCVRFLISFLKCVPPFWVQSWRKNVNTRLCEWRTRINTHKTDHYFSFLFPSLTTTTLSSTQNRRNTRANALGGGEHSKAI